MTTTKELKSELKTSFPGVKFSVKKTRFDILVEWILDLGSPLVFEVDKVAQKYSTQTAYGSVEDDSRSYHGTGIKCRPEVTQDRKDWAANKVLKQGKYTGFYLECGAIYDNTGVLNHTATQEYRQEQLNGM